MALIVIGASHHTAPVEVRERFVFGPGDVIPALAQLRRESGVCEAVLISTCNRTEIYLVEGEEDPVPAVTAMLAARLGGDPSGHLYIRRDRDAAAHLFRVASGIDSMILGEAQIQGQVRDAWEMSRAESGAALNRLFHTALQVASRVRTETTIGRGAASVSSASVQLARQIFGSLQGRRAMVLGAGEMAELALECLAGEGVRTAMVANRTFDRADALAQRYGASALHYDECWNSLHEVDLLICSTAAPHPVVTAAHVGPTLAARGDHPLCILDIALPRDVDPAVGKLGNVFLYDLDDLRAVVASNLDRRRAELPTAEQVIAAESERFWDWFAGLAVVPVLTAFRSEMDRVRERELDAAMRRMGAMDPAQREAIERFSRSLMNKFLHEPSVRLRAAAANGRGLGIVDAVRYLFALDAPGAAPEHASGGEPASRQVDDPTHSKIDGDR